MLNFQSTKDFQVLKQKMPLHERLLPESLRQEKEKKEEHTKRSLSKHILDRKFDMIFMRYMKNSELDSLEKH